MLPIKFAKEHIVKIEADMQKMKQRFVKLMREMDQNSKLIEEETKEYYVEFLKSTEQFFGVLGRNISIQQKLARRMSDTTLGLTTNARNPGAARIQREMV